MVIFLCSMLVRLQLEYCARFGLSELQTEPPAKPSSLNYFMILWLVLTHISASSIKDMSQREFYTLKPTHSAEILKSFSSRQCDFPHKWRSWFQLNPVATQATSATHWEVGLPSQTGWSTETRSRKILVSFQVKVKAHFERSSP